MKAGGTVENYMGDGALIGFNIPRSLAQHELAAATAALETTRAFEELKAGWVGLNPRFTQLHHRSGMSTGPLVRAVTGHPLSQRLSLVGSPIAVAAALCDTASRDSEIISISGETRPALGERGLVEPLPAESLGKAARAASGAYRLLGLR